MLRTTHIFPLGSRSTILVESLLRNGTTSRYQNLTEHGLSPSNRWRNRTSKSRTRNLFQNFLFKQSEHLETDERLNGVLPQPTCPFCDKEISFPADDGV